MSGLGNFLLVFGNKVFPPIVPGPCKIRFRFLQLAIGLGLDFQCDSKVFPGGIQTVSMEDSIVGTAGSVAVFPSAGAPMANAATRQMLNKMKRGFLIIDSNILPAFNAIRKCNST